LPKQQLSLEPGGPKRLVITWKGLWRNTSVSLDGRELGVIPDKDSLKAGRDFALPDGSGLHVQLHQRPYQTELQVLRNGQPLPGSASDPASKLKLSYGAIFFVAALNILLGLIVELTGSDFLKSIGLGVFSVVFGAIFLFLSFFVMKLSLVALIVAIVLFSVDAVASFVLVASAGGQPSIGGIVMRVFLLFGMAQGIPAIRAMKAAERLPPPVAYPWGGQGTGSQVPGPGPAPGSATGQAANRGEPQNPSDPENPYRRKA
jgi:hypothetical protein